MYSGTLIGKLREFLRFLSWNELKIACAVSSLIAALLLSIYLILSAGKKGKKLLLKSSLYVWGISFILLVWLFARYNDKWMLSSAIVISESLDVNSSPTSGGELLFTIHPGTKVLLMDDYGEYSKIAIEDGREGWIETNGVKRIIPED
jgi:uncharacterized protein YgiM (DUF1202 family)